MATDLLVARLVTSLVADTTEWNKGFGKATKTATSWSEKIKSAVIDQGTKLIFDGAKAAAKGVLDLSKAMVRLTVRAAPLPAIGASFRAMAGQVDLSLDVLRKAAAGTVSDFDLMRKANMALTGAGAEVAQAFGRDLPKLLEAARAASRATGKDVDFLFESLVNGVKRAQPLLIDNTGIIIKLGQANQTLATDLGKSVENLTDQERSIAILNATVEAGAKLVAQLGSEELTAAEKLQRFNATIQNARDQIGVGLTPVLGNFVGRMNDLAERVMPSVVSFIETKFAPAMDLIVDAMSNAAESAVDAGDSFVGKFGARLSEAADKALRWGIQISTDLATGIVKGAASALTAAMQFIGNLLTGWLQGASPPKVAPKLDKWGGEWMTELLRGMTEADFGILEKIQGPLSKVLSGPAFQNISGEIIEALSTGDAGPALFDKIAASAGQFGNEIAELARRQVALANATNAVTAAEEGLAKAREEQSKAAETVDALADEFNKLLAAGADPALLDAKRAEFDAAKDSLALADQEVTAAEDRKAAVEESLSPLQEQVVLQDKLLEQLFKLSTVGEDATDKVAAGIAGIGDAIGAIASMPAPKLPAPDFSAMTEAVTTVKTDLAAKFEDLFSPVREAWEKDMKPTLDKLNEEWKKFSETVKKFWDKKVQPVVDGIKEFLPEDLTENIGEWAGKILVAAVAVGILFGALTLLLSPIVLLAAGIVVLIALWDDATEAANGLRDVTILLFETIRDKLIAILLELGANIGGVLTDAFSVFKTNAMDPFKLSWDLNTEAVKGLIATLAPLETIISESLTETFNAFKTHVLDPIKLSWDLITEAVKNLINKYAELLDQLPKLDIPDWMKPDSPTPFEIGLRGISAAMNELASVEVPKLADSLLALPSPGGNLRGSGTSTTNNFFDQTINTQAGAGAVTQGYNQMRSMVQAN